MLFVSGVQELDPVIHTEMFIHLDPFSHQVITECSINFPLLFKVLLDLDTYKWHMLIPNS